MNRPIDPDRSCYNCRDRDTDRDYWPCNECDPYFLDKWNPREENSELNLGKD